MPTHCTFTNSLGEVVLSPSQGAFITVNGHLTMAPVKLSQGMNSNYYLLFDYHHLR